MNYIKVCGTVTKKIEHELGTIYYVNSRETEGCYVSSFTEHSIGDTLSEEGFIKNINIDGLICLLACTTKPVHFKEESILFKIECTLSNYTKVGDNRYILKCHLVSDIDTETIEVTHITSIAASSNLARYVSEIPNNTRVLLKGAPISGELKRKVKFDMMSKTYYISQIK